MKIDIMNSFGCRTERKYNTEFQNINLWNISSEGFQKRVNLKHKKKVWTVAMSGFEVEDEAEVVEPTSFIRILYSKKDLRSVGLKSLLVSTERSTNSISASFHNCALAAPPTMKFIGSLAKL